MKVSELAQELTTTSETILKTLKSLKLKAKDSDQELSSVVAAVVRSEFLKNKKAAPPAQEKTAKAEKVETAAKDTKKTTKKTEEKPKKAAVSKMAAVPAEEKKVSPAPAKPVKKTAERPKTRISQEPFITLKPLTRKRRKTPSLKETLTNQDLTVSLEMPQAVSAAHPLTAAAVEHPPSAEAAEKKTAVEEQLVALEIKVPITVKDFSIRVQQKPSLVLKQLMKMGILAHINQSLDEELVQKLAQEFGWQAVKIKTQEEQVIETHKYEEEDPSLLKPRAPVITFMGHVDHGKTSLLDRIRKTKVADSEHGGITQHIGAYSVDLPKGRITFLDTPGHEAFTGMRARGAHITDIVVLVVAADEGVMPQTEEAVAHARAAGVPIVVALNKIDRRNADPDRVKKELSERGLTPEDWGGKTVVVGVSAMTGEGVDNLLELILLESELLELKANAQKKASGIVVEANLSAGKGAMTTLIVQSGTLKEGDFIVIGPLYGRVRAMLDDCGRAVKEAGPSMPVEILGLPGVPEAGEMFYVIEDEKQAKEIASQRQEQLQNKRRQTAQRLTLEDLSTHVQEGKVKELNVIVKADVQGSLEALRDALGKIPSDKIKLNFIHMGVGDVSASDVLLAVASRAIIIAFHVAISPRAKEELEKEPVDVRQYRIIYDAVNDVKKALEGLLEKKTRKKFVGRVEIRQVFKLSKQGIIAGCYVTKGKVRRKDSIDIIRGEGVVFSGTLSSLKRFKDDVREVTEGLECGMSFAGFDQFQPGDLVEAYEIEKIDQKL